MNSETCTDGIEHKHEVGDILEKADTSEWKITNRMVDVDTNELLYRLREVEPAPHRAKSETFPEPQLARIFDVERSVDTDIEQGDGT